MSKTHSFHKYIFAAISFSILLFPNAAAQQKKTLGNITGTVVDSSGAAVGGAEVRLLNAQQLLLDAAKTNTEGHFKFENVLAGSYQIIASRTDFSSQRQAVQVTSGETTNISFVLQINQLTAQVTVTAETGLVENKNKVPQQINVITEDAIQQRVTAVLAQVAEEEEGASLQRTSPTIGAVLVRGLTEVGVYVDGVRYTNSTQRGGINTFFNLNEPTALRAVEIQRSPNTAQFGSDGLGGNVQLLSRQPEFGFDKPEWHGGFNSYFTSADLSFGSNAVLTYGTKRFGILGNIVVRRINNLRPGGGIDSHSAITRFLGLPSNIIGKERLPDTGFTQYGGTFHLNFAPTADRQISFRYQRSQQDGGKRYDQLLGGDGNLIADLRNLMLDFGYLRYFKQGAGFFDNFSATVSFNSQREERVNQGGQGNPLAAITHDKERTSVWGFNFFLDKHFSNRNNFLFGGDIYYDKVSAPSFSLEPASGTVRLVRPRVPNGATYLLGGLYVQDVFEAIPDRLRLSGALRYNIGSYRSRASNSPLVNNQPLFPDDSLRVADFSGRVGAVITIVEGINLAFNFSRGFRAPNITNLGSLGLVGVGYQVSTADVAGLSATIGTTADAHAVSTGVSVSPLKSETSNNYDLSLRYGNKNFDAHLTGFIIDYENAIIRQTLILPQGAVGTQLGSQTITSQNSGGAVFVPLSTSPVLVQANFGATRLKGVEASLVYRFLKDWTIGGNYSYVHAADKATGESPNLGGGGIPPQMGFLRLRYQPTNKNFWIEAYSNLAGRQDRLSTLDLSDRRTGAARSRSQIAGFFQRGACVRGLTTPGSSGQCGSAGGILIATGETLAQVQNRLLPIGAVVNGVLVVDNNTAVPLFNSIPGYGLINLRGGFKFKENHEISADFENIADKSHRAPGWGIDGPGRSITIRYQFRF
ncbi:MAG TPA: TonB-dependent receptor [Pyrinomonadaceae bacterium]|nr:TonB-dependent receptor [Pyrinomonadaceae bacterium]